MQPYFSAMATTKSRCSRIDVPQNLMVTDFIFSQSSRYPDRVALVDGVSGQKTTYGQLVDFINRVGSALAHRGMKKGETVVIFAPNCPQYAYAMYGSMKAGAVVALANPSYTAYELEHVLNISQPILMFTMPQLLPVAQEARKQCNTVREIYVLEQLPGVTSIQDLFLDDGSHLPSFQVDGNEVALLPFSSGTTGLSKGVRLSHSNLIANILQLCHPEIDFVDMNKEVWVATLPFYHMFGCQIILNTCMYSGGTIVSFPKFDFISWLKAVQDHKATTLHLVPPMALLLAKNPEALKYDLSSAKRMIVGAAALGDEVISQVLKIIPKLRFIQGYGMTELTSAATLPDPKSTNYRASGQILANCEAKVIDINTGQSLGPGKEGELCVRGPNVFKDYQTRGAVTKHALDADGWMHSGDIAYYDQNEEYCIVDKLKELIKCNADQVSPAELEDVLLKHADINDAAVIGVPDPSAGELPRAYVVKRPGSSLTKEEVKKFVANRMSSIKRLRGGVVFIAEIPKSPSGKILHRILRDKARAEVKSKL